MNTEVELANADMWEEMVKAIRKEEENAIKGENTNVCVLNMGNGKKPGGGVRSGIGAQEENLCRRTNALPILEKALQDRKYPLNTGETIALKEVLLFRKSEAKGYAFMENR